MNVFIVNMECDHDKRAHIEAECKRQNLTAQFIDAVNGALLTDQQLAEQVYRHELNHLTRGEIGCALSHQKIYREIIEKRLSHALILEDDALFAGNINDFMSDFSHHIAKNKKAVYLLHKTQTIFNNKKLIINDKYTFFEAYNAKCTHGYIITNKAAKTLLKINTPLIREADHWLSFYQLSWLKVYALNTDLIISRDTDKSLSTIEKERRAMTQEQIRSKEEIINKKYAYKVLKNYHKYIRRPFLKKQKVI